MPSPFINPAAPAAHKKGCKGVFVVRENSFYLQSKTFSGLHCPECNSLFDNPADSFWGSVQEHVYNSNPPLPK